MVCFAKIIFSKSSSSKPFVFWVCTHAREKCTCAQVRTCLRSSASVKIALLKYLQKKSILPNSEGPLSDHMPSESIAAANKEVQKRLDSAEGSSKRGNYAKYSDEERESELVRERRRWGLPTLSDFSRKSFQIVLSRKALFELERLNTKQNSRPSTNVASPWISQSYNVVVEEVLCCWEWVWTKSCRCMLRI